MRVLSPGPRARRLALASTPSLLVVTDDMPFLVDTMRMVLERHGLGVHLLVHPMLRSGATTRTASSTWRRTWPGRRRRRPIEAWTQIEIDRTDDATAPAAARPRSLRAVDDVRRAVDDFPAMRGRMEALGDVDPILPWLAEGQFVFLGAADYDVGRRTAP